MENEVSEVKQVKKARLSPDATVLLTIGATALAVIVYRVIYFIISGN